jgi:hypothetical protein
VHAGTSLQWIAKSHAGDTIAKMRLTSLVMMHSLTVVHLIHLMHLLLTGLAGICLQISPQIVIILHPATPSSTMVSIRMLLVMA